MLQAKLIQGFENYDIDHAPLRSIDGLEADDQLLIDVRNFQIKSDPEPTAEISFQPEFSPRMGTLLLLALFCKAESSTSSIRRPPPPRSMMHSRASQPS